MKLFFFLLLSTAALADRNKRQFFGGWWGATQTVSTAVQPVVHTQTVQQPVITQTVQQPVYQTHYNPPIVQNHVTTVDQPVYKHIQHTVAVPTPVIDPVVVQPRIIHPKPSVTKISVIQRAKRQLFGGWGWGSPSVAAVPSVASVSIAPTAHYHTNVVNPPVYNTVVQPVVHTQTVQPYIHTQSTVVRPVVHEVHSNVYVPQVVHIKPQIVEPPPAPEPKPSTTKISVIQRVKRHHKGESKISVIQRVKRNAGNKISVIQKRQAFFGGFPSFGVPAFASVSAPLEAHVVNAVPAVPAIAVPSPEHHGKPSTTKISVIQRA